MKTLVVEPDVETSEVLSQLLAAHGHDVNVCHAPEQAMALVPDALFELMIVNATLPGTDSLSFCRWLRGQPGGESFFIVIVTTQASCQGLSVVLNAGADDYIEFSTDKRVLETRISLAEHRAHRRVEREQTWQSQHRRLNLQAQRQAAIATLGQFALESIDMATLFAQAAGYIAQTIEVDFAAVYELSADRKQLVLREGTGWRPDQPGVVVLDADASTPEGLSLGDEPVIIKDWVGEPRFKQPPFQAEHGVRSSLCVAMRGPTSLHWVFGAYTKEPRSFNEDHLHFLQAMGTVLGLAVERGRNEMSIRRLAAFPRCNPNPVLELDSSGNLTYSNESAERLAESIGRNSVLSVLPPNYAEIARQCLASNASKLQQQAVFGRRRLSWSFFPLAESNVVHCYGEEITTRVELEMQLRQSQKMECVGQLAAGLAHDFNNVLTIIRGHTDLLLAEKNQPQQRMSSLNKIASAAERAANLTRELLTFSRRQAMRQAPLDLNACLNSFAKMLDSVLGDDIELRLEPSRDLPPVLADVGMLDQVIMNLAVNARDAMPRGGQLSITTSLMDIDETYVKQHAEARPGRFVCLSVADTGCGMDQTTLARLFEPFFTTKASKGTGLGLATVYGIVKQHNGWIEVISQPNRGTTFLVFLPTSDGSAQVVRSISTSGLPSHARGGKETILLVEDEPTLRELSRVVLQGYGYRVVEARSGPEALRIWAEEKAKIDLLLTDIVMPEGMSGADLATKLSAIKPSLKVILTSGFSTELIGEDALKKGIPFLQKPYPADQLARVVRECLDAR